MEELSTGELSIEILKRIAITNKDLAAIERAGPKSQHIMISCPVHGNPDSTTCSVNIVKGLYYCFSCGAGSNSTLQKLYYERTGHSIKRELGIATQRVPFIAPKYEQRVVDYSVPPDVDLSVKIQTAPVKDIPEAYEYCKKRGFTDQVIDEFRMRFAIDGYTLNNKLPDLPEKDRIIYFKKRLLIPIYEHGKLLCIEGRDIYGEEAWNKVHPTVKYKKCIYPRGGSTDTLYQWEKLDKSKPLYIVEGLMDVVFMHTCKELKNSTSLFGATITPRQVYLLSQFSDIVYIINNDKAGWNSFESLKKKLGKDFKVLLPPCGLKDVNEIYSKKGWTLDKAVNMKWLNYAKPASEVTVPKVFENN